MWRQASLLFRRSAPLVDLYYFLVVFWGLAEKAETDSSTILTRSGPVQVFLASSLAGPFSQWSQWGSWLASSAFPWWGKATEACQWGFYVWIFIPRGSQSKDPVGRVVWWVFTAFLARGRLQRPINMTSIDGSSESPHAMWRAIGGNPVDGSSWSSSFVCHLCLEAFEWHRKAGCSTPGAQSMAFLFCGPPLEEALLHPSKEIA